MSQVEIQTAGVVVDHYGHVLLRKDEDGRALVPPMVPAQAGRLPTDTLAEAIRAETGLIVFPLRLTGLFYDPGSAGGRLTLAVRCLLRGGSLEREDAPPAAAFLPTAPLPGAVATGSRPLLEQAVRHAGGPPALELAGSALATRLLRKLGASSDRPAGDWSVRVMSVIPDANGRVVVIRAEQNGEWALPAALVAPGEAPWDAARRTVQVTLGQDAAVVGLPAIYLASAAPEMTLLFLHETQAVVRQGGVHLLDPADEAAAWQPAAREQARTALQPEPATRFHVEEVAAP